MKNVMLSPHVCLYNSPQCPRSPALNPKIWVLNPKLLLGGGKLSNYDRIEGCNYRTVLYFTEVVCKCLLDGKG